MEPLLISGVLAMSLHAALLSVPVRNAPGFGIEYGVTPAASIRMIARLIAPDSGPPGVQTPIDPPPQATASHAAIRHAEPSRVAEQFRRAEPASPEPGGVALRLPGVLGDDDYFARQALDLAPYPTAPVLIEYPSADAGAGSHASELTLFIDENGKVVRIRVDGPNLPPAMEAAARSAFMGASFAPGQVDGLSVRSRIRVEVLFEEGPSPAERAVRPN